MAGKLGKAKAEFDTRDFPMKALLKTVVIPIAYDFDVAHPGLSYFMYANDQYGCCVISGRAHQTLRFEILEQNKLLSITDREVVEQYLKETGGVDSGLVVSRSIRNWRQRGWLVGGTRYYARAYARVNHLNLADVRAAIYADVGVGVGLDLPYSALQQFDKKQVWDVVPQDGGSAGGHYVYLPAHHEDGGFTCVTWGRRQRMTRKFFMTYADECWAVWDKANIMSAKTNAIMDIVKAEAMLAKTV